MLQGLSLGSLNKKYKFMLYLSFSHACSRKARMQEFVTQETSTLRSVAVIEEIITVKVQINVFAMIYCAIHESGKLIRYSD